MKKFLIILFNILVLNVYGQDSITVKTLEFEPFLGTTYGLSSEAGSRKIGPALGIEGRWNFQRYIDIGIQAYLGQAVTSYKEVSVRCRTISLTVFGDYNWNRGLNYSPFIGFGVGYNKYEIVDSGWYPYKYDDTNVEGVGAIPRIGMEFFRHIRVTLTGHLGKKLYNTIGLTVGYAFGGGKRNKSY
jgi:hypothetical protein